MARGAGREARTNYKYMIYIYNYDCPGPQLWRLAAFVHITHGEPPIAAAKTPEGKVGPKSETAAETKDETKAKAPANLTSKIAK